MLQKLKAKDVDNNGYITADEAKDFIQTHMKKIPEKTVHRIIKAFNKEDEDKVDYPTFVLFFAHVSARSVLVQDKLL